MSLDLEQFKVDLEKKPTLAKMPKFLSELEPEEAEALEAIMRDLSIPHARISQALKAQGYDIGPKPVQTWREQNVTS